jgi:hypothetical protein
MPYRLFLCGKESGRIINSVAATAKCLSNHLIYRKIDVMKPVPCGEKSIELSGME